MTYSNSPVGKKIILNIISKKIVLKQVLKIREITNHEKFHEIAQLPISF